MKNFNIHNFYNEKEKLIRKEIAAEWEAIDNSLFKNKNKKYQTVKFKIRKLQTMYGLIVFKRRIYRYYNIELKKWIYTSLLDEHLQVKKYKRIYNDVYNHVVNFLGDGKRYRDIKDTMPKTKISNMTISNIMKNANLKETKSNAKIKLKTNQKIYINTDDGFLNLRNERGRKEKYKIRIVTFNTGLKKNKYLYKKVLENKRVTFILEKANKTIKQNDFIDFLNNKINDYYELNNNEIVLGGDGAHWIKKTAEKINAIFILDRFHALRYLWKTFVPEKEFKKYCYAKKLFYQGNTVDLLLFLKENTKKVDVLSYFRNNALGIYNQDEDWNIGVSAESDIFHFTKSLLGNGAKIYNQKTYTNMINSKINKFNNTLKL